MTTITITAPGRTDTELDRSQWWLLLDAIEAHIDTLRTNIDRSTGFSARYDRTFWAGVATRYDRTFWAGVATRDALRLRRAEHTYRLLAGPAAIDGYLPAVYRDPRKARR